MDTRTEPDRQEVESDGHVLVLDASYDPIAVMGWEKAISLVLTDKADAVVDSERIISSPSVSVFMPAVIRLHRTIGTSRRRVAMAKRRAIFETHRWVCCYCGHKAKGSLERREMTIDHVLPTSRGGSKSDPMNQVAACRPCNSRKADATPEEARMKMLYPPRDPAWTERFALSFTNRNGDVPTAWTQFLPTS
jgi:5-methylcytosine-specific restriction endonuclease McrA